MTHTRVLTYEQTTDMKQRSCDRHQEANIIVQVYLTKFPGVLDGGLLHALVSTWLVVLTVRCCLTLVAGCQRGVVYVCNCTIISRQVKYF